MSVIVDYIKGSFYEFRNNVEFPKWNDLQSSTIVVAVATLILALFLFGVDEAFTKVVSGIYAGLKSLFY